MAVFPRSLCTTVIFTLLTGVIRAEPAFVPPSEVTPPFRRDRLPIDTDAMVALAQTMTLLSRGVPMDEAPQRRVAAQAIALALALDPASSSARDVLTAIAEKKHLPDSEIGKINHAKKQIWQLNEWLSTPEAGEEGNLLADLLGDIAAALDSENPAASKWSQSGERGKWKGWVASVSEFQKTEPIIPVDLATHDTNEESDTNPPEAGLAKLSPQLKSTSARINTVLYDYQPSSNTYVLAPVTVSMEAGAKLNQKESENGAENLSIEVTSQKAVRWQVSEQVSTPIIKALAHLHDSPESSFPSSQIRIHTGKEGNYSFRRNRSDMSGPGFILANSAFTGVAPDAFFIGGLGSDGKTLELPDFFWKKLNTLIDGPGGRLVVPAEAEEYLTALFIMENIEFFMKYEVLLAKTPQEAVRLCSIKPDEELAPTLAKFAEIKDKSSATALGSYLSNSHVGRRLEDLSQEAPYHLSAKLLALQGAGARPIAVDKKILAAEIFEAIDPFNDFLKIDLWTLKEKDIEAMDEAQKTSREQIERMERYAELRDRQLLQKAENLADDLRAMVRIAKDSRDLWKKDNDMSDAKRVFLAANRELRSELASLSGDPVPE